MTKPSRSRRVRLGLIGACILVLSIVLVLSSLEREHPGLGCAPPAVAATVPETRNELELERTRLDDPAPVASLATAPAPPPASSTSHTAVAGSVFDARTREAVPWIDLELSAGNLRWQGRTDEFGNFTCPTEFPPGDLTLRVADAGVLVGTLKEPWPQPFLRVPVPIGPTVFVDSIETRSAGSTESFQARMVLAAREAGSAGEIEVHGEELTMGGPDLPWSKVPVRRENRRLYARWPRVEYEESPDYHALVVFEREDPLERGAATVARAIGQQRVASVRTEGFLLVEGRLKESNPPAPKSTRVLIRPSSRAGSAALGRAPDCVEIDSTVGSFRTWVSERGRYECVSWADESEPGKPQEIRERRGRARIELPALFPLVERAYTAAWRVLVPELDPSGTAQYVRAFPWGTRPWARAEVFAWPGGSSRASEGLDRTRYEVELVGVNRVPVTASRTWPQTLPGELVLPVTSEERLATYPHRVEWIDVTDRTREDFLLTAGPSGCVVTTREFDGSSRWFLEPSHTARFTAWRADCAPIGVSADDFAQEAGEFVARIRLQTGWGVLLGFRIAQARPRGDSGEPTRRTDPGGASSLAEILALPPLPGVGVGVHGLGISASDEDGLALVSRLSPPDRLSLTAPGWRLRELQRVPGPGARWIALMERDEYE